MSARSSFRFNGRFSKYLETGIPYCARPMIAAMRLTAICSLIFGGAAQASCPAPRAGQPLPPQATARPIDELPDWRPRVDEIEHQLANSDLSRVKLLFLGDSIVERWDPDLFNRHFGSMGALHLGVARDTTQGMLWRLPRMGLGKSLRPDLIVMLIGANDTYPGGNPEAVAIGIGEIIRSIRNLSPSSRILLLGLLPRGAAPDDIWRQMGDQINRRIAACADNKIIFYADPGATLSPAGSGMSRDLEDDYLHPTPLGYRILSDALDDEITRSLK
ncbi:GDSL-type esterase/lipase family protein [Bradyrhizobium canariense]|uniref:Lysophospholipase L1 n=1 Tax=Bradyrhizobium canariense TaxID=255045 RepID=A0A1H2BJV4_9BRAD|nr:GDSL-type esterase/lipase family protein [Bradyrhizobium canariense]SDT58322.1 Lysophospholipase L1 [Bradyrhizobium canariense]